MTVEKHADRRLQYLEHGLGSRVHHGLADLLHLVHKAHVVVARFSIVIRTAVATE
jgi:hypothetical protein